ncbi:DUF2326 domain-containing protein [Liquorilactobacillus nagelii]|uniref:DUF2326 domain-containing protein n=1 Tax=Liquorilactobacillus nagelii TaxID=82688 RepID=UPI002430ADFA|nr:DUF2326 domain-containing protein [Liquorilactobacillus nagelii]MCI1699177.1 DUF2326 domain-containing protein [Liquorilactobacillus nagelii]
MFINKLEIETSGKVTRTINFHSGLNLIVDATPSAFVANKKPATGNGVGKTTVLRLIDFCFGKDPKSIYTDPEEKRPIVEVQNHLTSERVLVRLTLSSNPNEVCGETKYVIERNFFNNRNQKVLRINGKSFSGVQEFMNQLGFDLLNLDPKSKPSFRQIVARNFRIDPPAVDNTLKYLGNYVRGPEYETLFLFLLGIQMPDRAPIVRKLGTEQKFLKRLERQPREELALALEKNRDDITKVQLKRSRLNVDPLYSEKLQQLDNLKYEQNVLDNRLTAGKLRKSLIEEAQKQVKSKKSLINVEELTALYGEAQNLLSNLETSFDQLLQYNNAMVDSRSDFIGRELPVIEKKNNRLEKQSSIIQENIKNLRDELADSNTTQELENLSEQMGQLFETKGRLSSRIDQIDEERKKIDALSEELSDVDNMAFSQEMHSKIQGRLIKLNRFFYQYSQSMYGEDSGVTFRVKKDKATGKQYYDFYVFSPNNSSSGKKQGEIAAFDLGYADFAKEQKIPILDFVLYDKKELMHGNQLLQILKDADSANEQIIVPILADKIPTDLNADKRIVLRLSQENKLFGF